MKSFWSLEQHCTVIKTAILNTISKKNIKTVDINGNATTSEFMKHVLDEIESQTPEIGFFFLIWRFYKSNKLLKVCFCKLLIL